MLIDCRCQYYLSLIQKGGRIPSQVHLIDELKKQVVDLCLYLLVFSLTTCVSVLVYACVCV